MTADLKPYSEYKASNSLWLGRVPSHWEVKNLRTLIRPRNERNRADLPLLSVAREKGVFVRSLTDDSENHNVIPEDLSNYKVARAGSLVINKMKAWQGSMGIAPVDGIVSPAYYVYDFAITDRLFGQMLLRSKPYVAHFAQASDGVRVGQWDLSISGMRDIPVLIPPPSEQSTIVRFCTWANARIERAIRSKRKVIALLNEQKQAIIHRAVTRGLNPKVSLKPSGVPWIEDIPAHWEVRRLRASVTDCVNGLWGSDPDGVDDITCVRVADFDRKNLGVSLSRKTTRSIPISARSRRLLKRGDLLLEKSGGGDKQPVGAVVIYDHDEPAVCSNFVARLAIANGYEPRFLNYLHCALYARRINVLSIKQTTGIQNLDGKSYLAERAGFPSLDEQRKIADFLDAECGRFAGAIIQLEEEAQLLKEYQTRLVADVVTGKLDVREAAVNLPDETTLDTSACEDFSDDSDSLDWEAGE